MSGGKHRRQEGEREQGEGRREQQDRSREQEEYEREQELTALYRQALEAIREDAEQAVKEAVRSATPTAADWEEIVRRVVQEEMAGVEHVPAEGSGPVLGREPASRPWQVRVAEVGAGAVATALLLGAGWWAGRQWGPQPERATDPAGVPSVATDTIAPSADTMLDAVTDTSAVGADTLSTTGADTIGPDTSTTGPDTSGAAADTSAVGSDMSAGAGRTIPVTGTDISVDIRTDKTGQKTSFLQALSPDTRSDIETDKLSLEISPGDVP